LRKPSVIDFTMKFQSAPGWQKVRMRPCCIQSASNRPKPFFTKNRREIQGGPGDAPILSFRDGRDFIIIRQKRFRAEPAVHRLVGASREIYLFCQKHRSIKAIFSAFPDISDDTIVKFLNMMVGKKLMFAEKNKYLSLAAAVKQKSELKI